MIWGHTQLPLIPCALLGLGFWSSPGVGAEKVSSSPAAAPIAVVELFTSEACPSCPAADAYLRELAATARRNGEQLYPLSFHVDYWNPPGEGDPFSTQQNLDRQEAYVEAMGLDQAYTPQMIVNGTQ